jgi:hypothetical protein
MNNALEATVTWLWLNVSLACPFFLAWTLIPLRMVFKHPDTGSAVPAGEGNPAGRGAEAMSGSAPGYGPSTPAIPAARPHGSSEEALTKLAIPGYRRYEQMARLPGRQVTPGLSPVMAVAT